MFKLAYFNRAQIFAYAKTADQCLCFATRIVQSLFFLDPTLQVSSCLSVTVQCTAWFVSDLVGNPEEWFSGVVAQIRTALCIIILMFIDVVCH